MGFNTSRHEGIEITSAFTATVNFSLTPGSVSQTVTVSGEAPVLDTQDTLVQNIVSNTIIESLPIGKSAASYPALLPGAITIAVNQDVGAITRLAAVTSRTFTLELKLPLLPGCGVCSFRAA